MEMAESDICTTHRHTTRTATRSKLESVTKTAVVVVMENNMKETTARAVSLWTVYPESLPSMLCDKHQTPVTPPGIASPGWCYTEFLHQYVCYPP